MHDSDFPHSDPHNVARHWIAEKTGRYFTQEDLKRRAADLGVDYLISSAKGIYKPAGSAYAFSIRHEPTGAYDDKAPESTGEGTWSILYDAEMQGGVLAPSSTNALIRCVRDAMPIAVFWRHEVKKPYEVLGLGLPLDFSDGQFLIAGPYSLGRKFELADTPATLKQLTKTDGATLALRRLEQHLLRATLLDGKESASCRLCGDEFPKQLMIAAHIKPRRFATTQERLDTSIVTLMCKTGCDALFELGYLRVRDDGAIYRLFNQSAVSESFRQRLKRFEGRSITFRDERERSYFRYHREQYFTP